MITKVSEGFIRNCRTTRSTRVYTKVCGLAAWSVNTNGTALCH